MRMIARLLAILSAAMLAVQPVAAQSVLRDAETEAFLDEISAPLIEAAGLEPGNVDIVLIADPSINAFVAGGQAVYIHSGLIDAADSAEEPPGPTTAKQPNDTRNLDTHSTALPPDPRPQPSGPVECTGRLNI